MASQTPKVTFERWSRNAMAAVVGALFPARRVDLSSVKAGFTSAPVVKILFVRPHQGLGDLLLATPVFRALKQTYPHAQIHFLADSYNDVAIRDNRRLTRVWIWHKKEMKKWGNVWRLLRALRAECFDVAIPLFSHVPSFTSFMIARASGARVVWSYDTAKFYGGANWSRWLCHVVQANRPETDPEWVTFMELVRPLLPARTDDYAPEFFVKETVKAWAVDEWHRLQSRPLLGDRRLRVGVFLGGNPDRPERLWPADYWLELMQKIQERPDVELVAIVPPRDFRSGSHAIERGVFGRLLPSLKTTPLVFSHSALSHVAAFVQHLDLFVTVDGGLFHVAVASRVPTLGLFFVTDPARWKPPVSWATVLRPADDQPTSLTPEEVFRKVKSRLLQSSHVK